MSVFVGIMLRERIQTVQEFLVFMFERGNRETHSNLQFAPAPLYALPPLRNTDHV